MNICEELKEARINAGLTVPEAAKMLSVSPKKIFSWERGKELPSAADLIVLGDLYNVSLDELIRTDADMEAKLRRDVKAGKDAVRIFLILGLLTAAAGAVFSAALWFGGYFLEIAEIVCAFVLFGIAAASLLSAILLSKGKGKPRR